ncbi:hypothetical protein P3T36_002092 [Kitasatospora sp. MAP12-15]|uniref:alpha/beta hydrolase n=1 Tax=unclassified Kitasatospora TaxID=2633591 RepID=UPI00247503D5|nr:alpha/beta hydrolase [Kitasatospora sp. MAP12-44]MDH6111778.1 hypothetical protein [Kitasatospora sp. MAP12-44]
MDIATLSNADLVDLTSAQLAYGRLVTAFGQHVDDWRSKVTDRLDHSQWSGSTAVLVRADLAAFTSKLQAAHDELNLISGTLSDAAQSFALAQAQLVQALDDAKAAGITVNPDGSMTWDTAPASATSEPAVDPKKAQATYIGDRISGALTEADQADKLIAARLKHFTDNATNGTGLDSVTAGQDQQTEAGRENLPPQGATAAQVKTWWAGLTPAEQQDLIHNHPQQVGNLDGIPALDRDQANRLALDQQRAEIQAQLNQPEPDPQGKLIPGDASYVESLAHQQWREKHDELTDQLKGIDAIETRLDAGGTADNPPAYLLGFDTNGKGHAIVAINNPDTADNVVTYVPGTGARLGSINGDIVRSDRMVKSAEGDSPSIPAKTTSSVTWVGYDAPQSIIPQAADDKYAVGAEDKLHNFEVGLRATHEGTPARQTIIGHSYGTTTVGYTMRDKGLPVDAVMFVGSPGTGVENAKDLGIDPGHVWAGRGDADVIDYARSENPLRWAQDSASDVGSKMLNGFGGPVGYTSPSDNHLAFGRDPSDAYFGGHQIPTDPGVGHSDYWNDKGKSLDAMGRIISGEW